MENTKHKITKREYYYECGDHCCSWCGETWTLNGEEIFDGPDASTENILIRVLDKLGIQVEIATLDPETGEETSSDDNFNE
jgi:hypothetical protein